MHVGSPQYIEKLNLRDLNPRHVMNLSRLEDQIGNPLADDLILLCVVQLPTEAKPVLHAVICLLELLDSESRTFLVLVNFWLLASSELSKFGVSRDNA